MGSVDPRGRPERAVFESSVLKLLVLGVIALVIFGPDRLPQLAAQAGRALRDLRRLAEGARSDLRESLGPEFADFDFNDLNPRHFVRKHLFDDDGTPSANGAGAASESAAASPAELPAAMLAPGESPPWDGEAT